MSASDSGGSESGVRAGDVMVNRSFRVGGSSAPSGRGAAVRGHRWWCCLCEAHGTCRTHDEAMRTLLAHSDIHPAQPEQRYR